MRLRLRHIAHALTVMNSLAYDDIAHWDSHLKKLNEELLEKQNKKDIEIIKQNIISKINKSNANILLLLARCSLF